MVALQLRTEELKAADILFFFFFFAYLFYSLFFFVPSSSLILLLFLWWLFPTMKRERPEREARERGYCSSVLLYYLVFSILSLCSLVGSNLPPPLPGSTGSCSWCCWWWWRGKNNDGAQEVRNGSSSSLCRDP